MCDRHVGEHVDLLDVAYHLRRVRDVVALVETVTHITLGEMSDPTRLRLHAKARFIVAYITRRYTKRSYNDLKKVLLRDHTSIIRSVQLVERVIDVIGAPLEDTPNAWAKHLWEAEWPKSGSILPREMKYPNRSDAEAIARIVARPRALVRSKTTWRLLRTTSAKAIALELLFRMRKL